MDENQATFCRPDLSSGMDLEAAIDEFKPTILIGVTACPGIFTESMIRKMYSHCPQPLIFPLSNPTSRAECTAEQAFTWTEGNCIFASGSPFSPVEIDDKIFYPNQMNNMYCFPGIGLGAISCLPRVINNDILQNVAEHLSRQVSDEDLAQGKIFPRVSDIYNVSQSTAWAVVQAARKSTVDRKPNLPFNKSDFEKYLYQKTWEPAYPIYVNQAKDQVQIDEVNVNDLLTGGYMALKSSMNEPW